MMMLAPDRSQAAAHFRLYFYAAVANVIERVADLMGGNEIAFEAFPFLVGYRDELSAYGLHGEPVSQQVRTEIARLEAHADHHLPLCALARHAHLTYPDRVLLFTVGLVEEDERFSHLVGALQSTGQTRPTLGLLKLLLDGTVFAGDMVQRLYRLQQMGLLRIVDQSLPRPAQMPQVPLLLWDALLDPAAVKSEASLRYQPFEAMPPDDLILNAELRRSLNALPDLLASGEISAVLVRGPQDNQRRRLLGEMARRVGQGVLEVNGVAPQVAADQWDQLGPLAALLNALPVVILDLAPGETAALPPLTGYEGALGIVLGKQGGVSGPAVERAITLTVPMPDLAARRAHWAHHLSESDSAELDAMGERLHMTSGKIAMTAEMAKTYARIEGRQQVTLGDAQQASRAINRQVLETLAAYVPGIGDWDLLATGDQTRRELAVLESWCRHRERLKGAVSHAVHAQMTAGVRALLTGPSGTGKTLAARILASVLQKDLYRLDLSSIVNKYIGETEKNLNQVFGRAEELDVILLIDEGDSLLTQRTNVNSSTDRYANLETNFLLQRLEAYEGILIVTTNAQERIDSAFERRMDVIVEFRRPSAAERRSIWQMHLPAVHAVDDHLLAEVALRCELSGAQIRNVVLHASLLALNDGGMLNTSFLEASVRREYSKIGTTCPLRASVPHR